MRATTCLRASIGTCLLALAATATAQNAMTTDAADVYAGPDNSYPPVAQLDPDTPIQVMGCLDDWSWCDVGFDGNRGWLYSPDITYHTRVATCPCMRTPQDSAFRWWLSRSMRTGVATTTTVPSSSSVSSGRIGRCITSARPDRGPARTRRRVRQCATYGLIKGRRVIMEMEYASAAPSGPTLVNRTAPRPKARARR